MERVEFQDATVRTVELPVDRYAAVEQAVSIIRAEQPAIIIMLGEAGGRSRITPERIAINVDDFRIPDNVGNQPRNEPVVEGGPPAYFSTLPIMAIVDRINRAHIPAGISSTAGTYLCNRVFYSVMHVISTDGLTARAGFIHVPYLHDQVIAKSTEVPSLSKESIVEAVRLAIQVTVHARNESESRALFA